MFLSENLLKLEIYMCTDMKFKLFILEIYCVSLKTLGNCHFKSWVQGQGWKNLERYQFFWPNFIGVSNILEKLQISDGL